MESEFRVNDITSGWQRNPDVLSFPDGGYLIVWDSYYNEDFGSGYFIAAQRFDAQGDRVGNNIIIDARDDEDYRYADLALLEDGGIVIAYESTSFSQFQPDRTFLRIYEPDFSQRTNGRIPVDSLNANSSGTPEVVALEGGGFLVFTTVLGAGVGISTNIFVRSFDANGVAQGTEVQLNTIANGNEQHNPFATRLNNGNVIVIWDSEASGPNPGGLFSIDETRGSLLSANGTVLRSDFIIAPDSDGVIQEHNTDLDVTPLANGGFAITYYRTVQVNNDFEYRIVWRTFDANGDPTSGIRTAYAATEGVPDNGKIVELDSGHFVIVWDNPGDSFADAQGRIFASDGTPVSGIFEFALNDNGDQEYPQVAALAGGGFVVTYQSDTIDPDNSGIAARTYGRGTSDDDNVTVDFTGMFAGLGGDDSITGTSGANYISGGSGKDRVADRGGADTVLLGSGNDYVRVGGGVDNFYGGSGRDYISYYDSTNGVTINFATDSASRSWASNDVVEDFESGSGSRTGDDSFIGTSGTNVIRTYGGEDRVAAGKGSDKIYLGDDNDYVRVGGGTESFYGGQGRDYISYYDSSNGVRLDLRDDEASRSWASNDVISDFESASGSATGGDLLLGTNGKTTFRGYGGNDTLYGRSGEDKLYGGDGNDFFDGGADTDTLYGGAGADTFHFDKGEDVDVVKDFQNNVDTIELDGFGNGFDAFAFATQNGSDVVFNFGGGDRLTIEDVTVGQLANDLDVV